MARYATTVGVQLPQNGGDWANFGVSAVLAILGLLAKDARTGSQPASAMAPMPLAGTTAPDVRRAA